MKDFRRRFRTRFEGDPTRTAIYRGVSEGLAPAGIEFYLPLFFERTATLFDYLPRNAVIVHDAALPGALARPGTTSRRATRTAATTSSARCWRPEELFLEPAQSSTRGCRALRLASPWRPSRPTRSCTVERRTCATSRRSAPRELRIDARAEQPLAPLDAFLESFGGRVLIAADSPGRREVLQDMLRAHGSHRRGRAGLGRVRRTVRRALALTVAPDLGGLTLHRPAHRGHLRGAAVRRPRAPGAAAQARGCRPGGDPARSAGPESRRAGGARGIRCRPLRRPAGHGDRRAARRVPGARVRTATGCTCRCTRCTWSAAIPAARPRARRCTSSGRTSGRRRASAPPSRSATWPRSCSTCTRAARRRKALSLPLREIEYQAFANAFPFEETEDQAEAIRAVLAGSAQRHGRWTASSAAMSASARPKSPCARRSSRSRPASRSRCWRRPRCWRSSTWPTSATASPTGRCASRRCRASAMPRRRRRRSRASSSGTVDIVIATHRLLHAHARFKDLGLHHHR